MDMNTTFSINFDMTLKNFETLNIDLKRINDGLERSCKDGVFGLKESQMLCTSMENFAQLLDYVRQSVQKKLDEQNQNKTSEESHIQQTNDGL